jgi:hypothetical protein
VESNLVKNSPKYLHALEEEEEEAQNSANKFRFRENSMEFPPTNM